MTPCNILKQTSVSNTFPVKYSVDEITVMKKQTHKTKRLK